MTYTAGLWPRAGERSWDPRRPGQLGARTAELAERIADLLEVTCTPEAGASAAVAYLRSYAQAAVDAAPPVDASPMDRLGDRFGLSDLERTLFLLAGLPEEHEGLAGTFRALHPRGEPRPTVGLGALLTCGTHGDRERLRKVLAEGPALRHGLLRLIGEGPLFERSLVPAPALWEAIHGVDGWPGDPIRIGLPEGLAAGLEGWLENPVVRAAIAALESGSTVTLLVPDDDEQVALSRCVALVDAAGTSAVAARVDAADASAAALVVAHAVARRSVPLLVLGPPADGAPPALDLGDLPGPVLVVLVEGAARPVGARPAVVVPVGPLGTDARRRAWRAALPGLANSAPALAARHPLDPALTAQVAADLRMRQRLGGLTGPDGVDEVTGAIRARMGLSLPAGVRLRAPAAGWDRLVLPPDQSRQLHDAVDRLRLQPQVLDDWGFLEGARADRGVRLLFTGTPGTGKTLAAEVLAHEGATDLLVVDVSQVVSKWIGETEKNLATIFDVAERTRAVLFLDEAEALFSTRTQVSDAHDRYANLETAYLLQRLDRFDGLAVLATNLRQNIDAAFLRRMDFVVEFPLPAEEDRARLWRLHLPGTAPVDPEVDPVVLARVYPVPGAWIRNAAIAAAFLAAAESAPLARRHLATALRREYAKAARPYPGDPPVAAPRREDSP